MGTRSTIAIENADGTVTGIYCHWDGYPSCNGRILAENYTDEDSVRELIALGDLSSLGKTIGNKVDFNDHDAHNGQCVAYSRDRGETGVAAQTHKSWAALLESFGQEFNYLFKDGAWTVDDGRSFCALSEALAAEEA